MSPVLDSILTDGAFQRLAVAFAFSFLIGLERHSHGRPAGVRTHILVGLASCLVMLLPEHFMPLVPGANAGGVVDPTRIAAGALTGVGFLGAGVILKDGATVTGLTTAACIWTVCVIGMAVGSGLYLPAVAVLGLTLFTLIVLRWLERAIPEDRHRYVRVELVAPTDGEDIAAELRKIDARIKLTEQRIDKTTGRIICGYSVRVRDVKRFSEAVEILQGLNDVRMIHVTAETGD